MGFELATSMTVDKRFIHFAKNSPCDFVCAYNIFDVIKCVYYFKKGVQITLLLVNIIANTECQHSQNNAAGLYVSLSLQSHVFYVRHCLHLRTSICQTVKS